MIQHRSTCLSTLTLLYSRDFTSVSLQWVSGKYSSPSYEERLCLLYTELERLFLSLAICVFPWGFLGPESGCKWHPGCVWNKSEFSDLIMLL